MPQYLSWSRQERTVRENLRSLACRPGALLLTEGDRVLGTVIINAVMNDIDDHLGDAYEEAFRDHLRRLAASGGLGTGVVAVGPWWRRNER